MNKIEPEKMCLMPFTSLNLEPDGSVSVCRHKGTDFIVGSLKENSLAEIWNGPKLKAWREEFLTGKIETCKWEMENLSCHRCSVVNSLSDKVDLSLTPKAVLRLGANFNGKCNLQCRMCDVWSRESGLYTSRNYWALLKKNVLPHLEVIDFFSGEPFIQEDTFKMSVMMNEVNPGCRWLITTNGHFDLTDKIRHFLMTTNITTLVFSLDSLDSKQYSEIRCGGDLNRVLSTIDAVLDFYKSSPELKKPFLAINFLVMNDNYKQIPLVREYTKKRGIELSLGILQRPQRYSLLEASVEERLTALEFLYDYSKKGETLSHRSFNSLLHSLPMVERKTFLFNNSLN